MSLEGIHFVVATPEDGERIFEFCDENFFPDEPISRSFGVHHNKSWTDTFLRNEYFVAGICPCLDTDYSILALDQNGDIVGVKLGLIKKRDEEPFLSLNLSFLNYFKWLLPTKVVRIANLVRFAEDICGFTPDQLMRDLGSEKIFLGELLCVARRMRGCGLGRILARKSLELAAAECCDYYAVLATSKYSQRIYSELEFSVLREQFYKDFVEEDGSEIVSERREHESAKCLFKRLVTTE